MAKKKRNPDSKAAWRQFEILIAQIESALVPLGAHVTTPDKIPDLTTGDLREVDASIRYQVGSTPILITVECRDRSRKGDVTWIEGLVTKKANIGASNTIAVSPRGFSRAAIDLARRSGIEVRQLGDVSTQEILSLFDMGDVFIGCEQRTIGNLLMTFYGPKPNLEPDPNISKEQWHGNVFRLIQTDTPVSVDDVLMGFGDPEIRPYKGIPADGKKYRIVRTIDFEDQMLSAPTAEGPACVKRMIATLDLWKDKVPGVSKGFEYRNVLGLVGQGLQHVGKAADGSELRVMMCKEPGSDVIKCSLVKFDEPTK